MKENIIEGFQKRFFSKFGRNEDSTSAIEDYLINNPDYQIIKEDDCTIIKLANGDYKKYDNSYKLVESLETSEGMNIKTILVNQSKDFDKFYQDCLKLKDQYQKLEDMSEVTGKG